MPNALAKLSLDDLNKLVRIHTRLSPENISSDGEASRDEVDRRYTRLTAQLEDFQTDYDLTEAECEEGLVYAEFSKRTRAAHGLAC